MKVFSYNKVLIAFIIIGLLASFSINLSRIDDEKANNTIDLVVDYEGLVELAQREGLPEETVLAMAKEDGITSLAVYERTFKKLNKSGKVTAASGAEILDRYGTGSLVSPAWRELVERGEIKGEEVYVTNHDDLTFQETKEDLIRRLGQGSVRSLFPDGKEVFAVKAHAESFPKLDLGMPTDEMKKVNAAGFHVVVRPTNYINVTPDDVAAVFRRLDGIKISEFVVSGKQALGAFGEEETLAAVAKELDKRNITLGLIEAPTQLQFFQQEGLLDIAAKMNWRAARLYSIDKAEQEKMKVQQAINRWKNTDEERNIRISLLHIFKKSEAGQTLLETNRRYFRGVRDALLSRGYKFGPAGVFRPLEISPLTRALVVIGTVAAGVLYLSLVIPALNSRSRLQLIIFAALSVIFAAPVLLGAGNSVRLVTSLASANLFPALAMTALFDFGNKHRDFTINSLFSAIILAAAALVVTGALSFIGASYLSAALSDVEYFLEVRIFRGIKLTFIAPLILVAVAFLQRFNIFGSLDDEASGFRRQFKEVLDATVTVRSLALLGVAGLAAVVFIARSGHSMGMPVPGIELKLRALLEKTFYARPRTKEMFIGHPAFMLMAYAWLKKWPSIVFFVLVMGATIAQGSMVETFAHMRTPFLMSAVRGVGGLVFGGLLGAIAVTAVAIWQNILEKVKYSEE